MKFGTLFAAAAVSVALAGTAQAVTLNQNAADGFEAGTGIPNGFFTKDHQGGFMLDTRARPYPELPIPSIGNSIFLIPLGKIVSMDLSVWLSADGQDRDEDDYDAIVTVKNFNTGLTATFDFFDLPDNEYTSGGAGSNSERYSFCFIACQMGGYNQNQDNTFLQMLTLKETATGATLARTYAWVQQGDGTEGFQIPTGGVPEPATWAMMILGFGGVGTMIRRRRVLVPA